MYYIFAHSFSQSIFLYSICIMTEVLKIASWNVNSIRTRMHQVLSWVQKNTIDVILLQELKCTNDQFPFAEFEDLGFNCYVLGQKTYNGVAILSKIRASCVITEFDNNPCPDEARFIEIEVQTNFGYLGISSVYVPNGASIGSKSFEKKLLFLDGIKSYLASRILNQKYIIGGDFNVAPEEKDVYNPETFENQLLFSIEERSRIRALKYMGMIDPSELAGNNGDFTWWDYRGGAFANNKGARIDYFLASPFCISNIAKFSNDKSVRALQQASDHAPLIVILK
ncbi:MAG: exodeoxyribonuclease III [Alphaproteobacteria bacterium]|nr:exodeoxyribonuclease III [Alphaproteobacteria bacterium]